MSDVEWAVKFGAPGRVTAKPEAGVEMIVTRHPLAPTSRWTAQLVIHDESAWSGAGYKLSSEAKGVCEERYRRWRKRQL